MHYLPSNPMQYVKFPKVEKAPKERIILTLDEWQRIIDRFPPVSRYHIPLMIGFYTGLRISEAFALTWDDIDFEKRPITVSKQIVKRNFGANVRKVVEKKGKKELKSSWYFTTTKTPSSERTVKFGDALYKALKSEYTAQRKNELRYSEYYTIHVLKKNWMKKAMTCFGLYRFRSACRPPCPVCVWSALQKTGNILQPIPSNTVQG